VSDRSGAVLIVLWLGVGSGSKYLLLGEESLGLFSSPRIDLVLPSKLNGFGLFFLMVFTVVEDSRGDEVEGGCDSAPTGLRARDLSTPESIELSSVTVFLPRPHSISSAASLGGIGGLPT
jgi:hypothetical protein